MSTKLTDHHEMFIRARLDVRELLATSKSAYHTNKIDVCEGIQKAIFNVINNVLHRKMASFPDIFHSDE